MGRVVVILSLAVMAYLAFNGEIAPAFMAGLFG